MIRFLSHQGHLTKTCFITLQANDGLQKRFNGHNFNASHGFN